MSETENLIPSSLTVIGESGHPELFVDQLKLDRKSLFHNELPILPERAEQIKQMTEAVNLALADLGIDKSFKSPNPTQIHYYHPNDYEALSVERGLGSSEGALVGLLDIVVKSSDNDEQDLHITNHELVHLFSAVEIELELGERGELEIKRETRGLATGDKEGAEFNLLNESVTELANVWLIKNYWRKTKALRGIPASLDPFGYQHQASFTEHLLEYVAHECSLSFDEIRDKLFIDMFTGTKDGLNLIVKVIGEESMKRIANMPLRQKNLDRLEKVLFRKNR